MMGITPMKTVSLALCFVFATNAWAQRLPWRPSDFSPLTSLPWADESKPMHKVLETIFLEPNPEIRYPVLADYLRMLPLNKLDTAFVFCTAYEGHQNPGNVVGMFLEIWAERDPEAAWKKTLGLFDVVVIEGDPLSLDSWGNPRIQVVNHQALQASSFWLSPHALDGFRRGLARSSIPGADKKRLLKEFVMRYVDAFAEAPGTDRYADISSNQHEGSSRSLINALTLEEGRLRSSIEDSTNDGTGGSVIEACVMRWLSLRPSKAAEILQTVENSAVSKDHVFSYPWFMMLWSRLDLTAMREWTEKQDILTSNHGIEARGVLMSRVDERTQQRWLYEAAGRNKSESRITELFENWSRWNPEDALKASVASDDPELLERVAEGAVYPFIYSYNGSHWGLGIVRDFDLRTAGAKWMRHEYPNLGKWGVTIMEQWSDVDVGEAARYGFHFLTEVWPDYMPRHDLIEMLSGNDQYGSDADMIDRTFCCLRFWAMWKPNEMHKWIETIPDADLRKALTWTLKHPWGDGLSAQ